MKNLKLFNFLLFIIPILLLSSCIVYKPYTSKFYEVISEDTTVKKEWLEEKNIYYISPNVVSLFWADIYRKKGFFVYDFVKKGDSISYYKINEKIVNKLKLKPKFTFWQNYGKYVLLVLIFILIFFKKSRRFLSKFELDFD